MTAGADLPPFVQAGEPAPDIPQAGPAYAGTTLPLPPFPGRTLPEAAADSTCTSLICQMDPGTDLVLLTLYVMLCFAAMKGVLKLVTLLWMAARQTIDLLDHYHAWAMTARAVPRAPSPIASAGSAAGG